jgi:flagellar hook protein FlgE
MYSNVSAINANQNWLNANASNVANVNSSDYKALDTTISESNTNPTANISRGDSGTTLSKEMTENINIVASTEANVTSINTQDSMTKTLLDIKA